MKNRRQYISTLLFLFLFTCYAEAQQYSNGSPYYGRRSSTLPESKAPVPPPAPMTADEIVAAEMPTITELLELNDFEQAVVATILSKYIQQRIELQILDLEPQKTKEAIEKITKNQQAELKAGLPEEKFIALEKLQKDGYKKKKKRLKKKKEKS